MRFIKTYQQLWEKRSGSIWVLWRLDIQIVLHLWPSRISIWASTCHAWRKSARSGRHGQSGPAQWKACVSQHCEPKKPENEETKSSHFGICEKKKRAQKTFYFPKRFTYSSCQTFSIMNDLQVWPETKAKDFYRVDLGFFRFPLFFFGPFLTKHKKARVQNFCSTFCSVWMDMNPSIPVTH